MIDETPGVSGYSQGLNKSRWGVTMNNLKVFTDSQLDLEESSIRRPKFNRDNSL